MTIADSGTSAKSWEIGLTGLTLDSSNISTGYTLKYPAATGTSGQTLITDGSGNLSWSSTGGAPAGSNTQIQYNNSGAFGASASLTLNGDTLVVGQTSGGHPGDIQIQDNVGTGILNMDGSGDLNINTTVGNLVLTTVSASVQIQPASSYFWAFNPDGSLDDSSGSEGTSGQVLTSAGSGAPAIWQTPTGGGLDTVSAMAYSGAL